MPDLISTIPGDIGSGGPTMPAADPAPQPEPSPGAPTPGPGPGPDTPPPGDKGGSDPGKSGAPAATSDTPPDPKPSTTPTPAGPTDSPEVQALRAQLDTLTQLVGQLMPGKTAAPAAPVRDFAGEKAVLDEALRSEQIDAATYHTKIGQLTMDAAEAKALAATSAGTATTVEQMQAILKKGEDATNWKALCAENDGLADFARSPEFAKIKAANPLHDPLSAYLTHQLGVQKAGQEKAIADAVAAKEKEMVAAIMAKGHSAVLGNPGGQAPQGGQDFDAMLKEPEKYGGVAAVQAAKLKHTRASAGR